MMGVVNLGDEIRDRELQRMGEEAARLILRREAELGAEILEDVGDMRDDDCAVAQERRGERAFAERRLRASPSCAFTPRPAPSLARDIDVRRAGRLERETHKLAASLEAWPVVEFVGHRNSLSQKGTTGLGRERAPGYGLPASRGSICWLLARIGV